MGLTLTSKSESYLETVSIVRNTSDLAVTLSDAKAFARVDTTIEDSILEILRESADRAFEEFTHSLLFDSTVTAVYSFDGAGTVEFRVPYCPVVSVTSVKADGTDVTYEQSGNWIEISSHDGDDVTVIYDCKLFDSPSDVDAKIKIGLLKWIATNYNDRENTIVEDINEMPNGSERLWKPYRYMIP